MRITRNIELHIQKNKEGEIFIENKASRYGLEGAKLPTDQYKIIDENNNYHEISYELGLPAIIPTELYGKVQIYKNGELVLNQF